MSKVTLNQTVVEAIDYYINDCFARGESNRTIEMKYHHLNHFAHWAKKQKLTKLKCLDLALVEAYRRYLREYIIPHNKQRLDLSTVRNYLTTIKTFVKRLYYHDVFSLNPLDKLELPRKPPRLPKRVLSIGKVERCLSQTSDGSITGLRNRVICELYFATGIRRTELAHLQLDDIDTTEQLLTINLGKGAKDRIIPLSERACLWIGFYIQHLRPLYANWLSGNILFLNDKGQVFKPASLSDMVGKYVRRSGVAKSGATNLFRHASATMMLDNDADIRIIQAMLGHADISTTQIYTHVSTRKLSEVYHKTHPSAIRRLPPGVERLLNSNANI